MTFFKKLLPSVKMAKKMGDVQALTTRKFLSILFIITGLLMVLLFGSSYRCTAEPIWPDDPNKGIINEDRIGYEDGNYMEFFSLDPNEVIHYDIRKDPNKKSKWINFPHRLNAKNQKPHTVHLLFDTNADAAPQNLIMAVKTDPDAPTQFMGIFFDGRPIHPLLGIKGIEVNNNFEQRTFWLGYITQGVQHTITITNETDPNTSPGKNYGIFFDYLKLVPAPRKKIFIPEQYPTILEGIEESTPGDIIIVKQGTYQEKTTLPLKSGITLRSWSGNEMDPNEIDPNSTIISGNEIDPNTIYPNTTDPNSFIISGGEKIALYGAYQSKIKGFTIKNGDIGIMASHDFMSISNNIILSDQIGILLSGQDLNLVNNTIVPNDCGLYIYKSDHDTPTPSLQCSNNIFSDGNCPLYILTDPNSKYRIDFKRIDNVIKDFSYNNLWTKFQSNVHLKSYGKKNINTNPYFVNPNNHDYHLMLYSPCIDAGEPNADYSREPDPNNGERINIGAFGNTPQAQKSKDADRDGAFDYFEGPGDIDQNGRPDWQNNQTAVFRTTTGQGFELEVGAGRIAICLQADANTDLILEKVKALKEKGPEISSLNPPKSHYYYGFWEFTISGLDQGDEITIAILCPHASFFDSQEYYAYDPENGWSALSIQKDPAQSRIYITLSDGGKNDNDTSENGTIFHRGAIAVPLFLGEEYDYKSCFISNL